MKVSTLCFLVLLIAVITVDISDARPRGGGGRGGGGRGGGSRSGGSRSRGGGGSRSGSKPKITKNTPIKATTIRSPVIKLQTRVGSRSAIFKGVLVGYVLHRYLILSNAPVYRQGYPMYGSYVSIPNDRAVRLSYEEEKMLDADGNLCLGQSSRNETLRDDIDEFLVEINTTVTYKKSGKTFTFHGTNRTVVLEDIPEEDLILTSRARYNTTLVAGTVCTQVEKKVDGTMVQLYETNPNGASTVTVNTLMMSSTTLFGLVQIFKPVFSAI